MRERRLVLSEEPIDHEMEAVTLNQASAEEEVPWTWKREALQTKKLIIKLYSRRSIVDQIAEELKLIGDGVYQEFINSCFGFLMRLDTQGSCCKAALHCLIAHEVVKEDAGPDELWYRVGGQFIRFSKFEYALVTGLSFGPTAFNPSAEHHPPSNGLFLRYYHGQRLKMDTLLCDFTDGVFRESPADALKVAKLLIAYFLLFGMDEKQTYIDLWAWTLIEDSDGWETFMWGKYTYQILLRYLQRVPIEKTHALKSSYRLNGYVWAFLIWAFEAIPELGIAFGVPTFDDLLPRCLRWRFQKITYVDMSGFCDRQMEVHSTLEPSAEEQGQPYWEHIHDDLRSNVCYIHPQNPFWKKKTPCVNPSSHDVLPVSRPQGAKATRIRGSHLTSAKSMEFKKKRKMSDPMTTCAGEEKVQKKLSAHESGRKDVMSSLVQKKLSRIVRGELPVLLRQELPSVIHLALKEFFLHSDPTVGGTSSTMRTARPREEKLSLSMDCELESSSVAVDQAGRNKLTFKLNEKIKELKNKNLESKRLVRVLQEKCKRFDAMVVKMGKENEKLKREKLAAIKTVEELKRKNLEVNLKKLESDKAVSRLMNLSPKIMKIEVGNDVRKIAISEEVGDLDTQDFKGDKDNSGNGSRSSGLSKKATGDRKSAHPRTREDDAAHIDKTYHGSQSRHNPPQSESNDTVNDNEHREPRTSGNITKELIGFNDEASTDDSDESCTDSRMDDLITSLRSKGLCRKWTYESDLLCALQQDEQLCMNAVCALYRQHVVARKSMGLSMNGGFGPVDSLSGCALAEYLIDGDKELRLMKSVSEVKKERPDVISQCRKLATIYVEKLFEIYCSADDPFFGQS